MSSKLRVKLVTWNVQGLPPATNLDLINLFSDEGEITDADLIAIGLQEVSFRVNNYFSDMLIRNEPWSDTLRNFLMKHDYVQLSCGWTSKPRLMGLIMLIFVKRISLPSIVQIETKFVKTGFSGFSSHKGAVSARLTLTDGTHITFISAHLCAGFSSFSYRMKEYHMILAGLNFDPSKVISDGYVFWFGDLNFRIENFTFEQIVNLIDKDRIDKLLEYDQLRQCSKSKLAFNEFQEGQIKFMPSYKFFTGKSPSYDSKRRPSWCDRILYRVDDSHCDSENGLSCEQINYDCISSYNISDHKPVTALFSLDVYNVASKNLITFLDRPNENVFIADKKILCRYQISNLYYPSVFDWIGIFRPEFSSDSDTVTWMYVGSSWEDKKKRTNEFTAQNILFKHRYVPPVGRYLFGYYSREKSCLIGLSNPFDIVSSKVSTIAKKD